MEFSIEDQPFADKLFFFILQFWDSKSIHYFSSLYAVIVSFSSRPL